MKLYKYILVFLTLGFSAFSFFFNQAGLRYAFVLWAIIILLIKNIKINKSLIIVFAFFFVLLLTQSLSFGTSVNRAMIVFIYQSLYLIFISYVIIKIIGIEYPRYLVNIIYIYSIISLIFWALTNVFPSFHESLYSLAERLGTDPVDLHNPLAGRPEQFLLYTYEAGKTGMFLRNPGPFHEPGAFAVFLIYGIVFNTILTKKLLSGKNIVMIISMITTFSSAGYIGLFIIINFYLISTPKIPKVISIILVSITIVLSIYVYNKIDFLGSKVEEEYQNQADLDLSSPTSGRFFSARKAIYVLENYPLTGRMLSANMKDMSSKEAAGYGFMAFAAEIGIPLFLLIIFFTYKSIKQYCLFYGMDTRFAFYGFVALLMVLFSQTFSKTHVFLILFLTSLVFGEFGERKLRWETQKQLDNNRTVDNS